METNFPLNLCLYFTVHSHFVNLFCLVSRRKRVKKKKEKGFTWYSSNKALLRRRRRHFTVKLKNISHLYCPKTKEPIIFLTHLTTVLRREGDRSIEHVRSISTGESNGKRLHHFYNFIIFKQKNSVFTLAAIIKTALTITSNL